MQIPASFTLTNAALVLTAACCTKKAVVETAKLFGKEEAINKFAQDLKNQFPACPFSGGDKEIKMSGPLAKAFGEGPYVIRKTHLDQAASAAKAALFATTAFYMLANVQF